MKGAKKRQINGTVPGVVMIWGTQFWTSSLHAPHRRGSARLRPFATSRRFRHTAPPNIFRLPTLTPLRERSDIFRRNRLFGLKWPQHNRTKVNLEILSDLSQWVVMLDGCRLRFFLMTKIGVFKYPRFWSDFFLKAVFKVYRNPRVRTELAETFDPRISIDFEDRLEKEIRPKSGVF